MRRFLSPLVLALAVSPSAQSPSTSAPVEGSHSSAAKALRIVRPTMLPRAISSFGAAAPGDGWVYVYGGHTGRAHAHSKENIRGEFFRLNAMDGQTIQALPSGPALQGTALAAYGTRLYRVGGLSALNAAHEDADTRSVASVDVFEIERGRWRPVTDLPMPRSSHDAFVVGHELYVVGGWNLQGSWRDATWHTKALVADLREEPLVWREIATPFKRRAFSIAGHGGQVVALGGLGPDRSMPSRCMVLDCETKQWREGPELIGPGFGIAATTVEGQLYASGMDGRLVKLRADLSGFDAVRSVSLPRYFHRLVPWTTGSLVALGGVAGAHSTVVERVALRESEPEILEFTVPFVGAAMQDQVFAYYRGALYAAGGRSDHGPVDETLRISLADMKIESSTPMPAARASASVALLDRRGLVFGGFDAEGRPVDSIFEFMPRSKEWYELDTKLDQPRAGSHAIYMDDSVLLLGGVTSDRGATKCVRQVAVVRSAGDRVTVTAHEAELPRPRRDFACAKHGGKIYLVGGVDDSGKPVTEVDVFDPAAGKWTTGPAVRKARIAADLVEVGDTLYLVGGRTPGGQPETSIERLTAGGGWEVFAAHVPFLAEGCRAFSAEGRLLFVTTAAAGKPIGTLSVRLLDQQPWVVHSEIVESSFRRR